MAAIVATAVWTFLDRRRNNYIKLHKWFRVFLRFALASQMLVYGFMKVFALQMSSPDLLKLVELYGNFSPMAVLWTSIGVAPAYRFFAGSAELLGGLLLLLPVTSMLGALVCAADMAMVFVLNMSYDVPVKILSFHLLLIALFLLAPDVRRLIDFFFTNRATAARGGPQLFQGMRANRLALACQLLLGAYLAGFTLQKDIQYWYEWGGGSPKPALYGIWEVKEMAIDGQVRPSLLTDAQRWRRVIFESFGDIEIQGMDESVLYFKSFQQASMLNLDDKGPFPIVGYPGHPGLSGKFAIDRLAPDELTLDGTMGGHNIHTELRRVDLRQFTLVSRGFHWISEYPFQR
ncbi:MAG TPA: hypothetical protein VGT08_07800 [Terracidiphilus sp.]|nr:hypothetical protein [Terracidiphilus sp.]